MRKPRDFDAELKALTDKARQLKSRKQNQLGGLVMATGADAMTSEELAGALLDAAEATGTARKEAWRKRGAAFFQNSSEARRGTGELPSGAATDPSGAPSSSGSAGAQ